MKETLDYIELFITAFLTMFSLALIPVVIIVMGMYWWDRFNSFPDDQMDVIQEQPDIEGYNERGFERIQEEEEEEGKAEEERWEWVINSQRL